MRSAEPMASAGLARRHEQQVAGRSVKDDLRLARYAAVAFLPAADAGLAEWPYVRLEELRALVLWRRRREGAAAGRAPALVLVAAALRARVRRGRVEWGGPWPGACEWAFDLLWRPRATDSRPAAAHLVQQAGPLAWTLALDRAVGQADQAAAAGAGRDVREPAWPTLWAAPPPAGDFPVTRLAELLACRVARDGCLPDGRPLAGLAFPGGVLTELEELEDGTRLLGFDGRADRVVELPPTAVSRLPLVEGRVELPPGVHVDFCPRRDYSSLSDLRRTLGDAGVARLARMAVAADDRTLPASGAAVRRLAYWEALPEGVAVWADCGPHFEEGVVVEAGPDGSVRDRVTLTPRVQVVRCGSHNPRLAYGGHLFGAVLADLPPEERQRILG